MNTLVPFIQYVSQPMVFIANILVEALSKASHRPPQQSDNTAAAFVVSVGVIGVVCIYWACWTHARLGNIRLAARQDLARSLDAMEFRNALLAHGSQAIIVMRRGEKDPQYFGEASSLLQACRAGRDGPALAEALEELVECGDPFTLVLRTAEDRVVEVRGLPIGGRAVLYLQEEASTGSGSGKQLRELLEALPMPIWLRDNEMRLIWANRALLNALAIDGFEQIGDKEPDWLGRDLSAAASESGKPLTGPRPVIIAGQRHVLSVNLLSLKDNAVAGFGVDMTDIGRRVTELSTALDVQTDMMERLPFAIAVFDEQRRLVSHNSSYSSLWDLPEAWLDTHPLQDEIFDRLRESRKLPEQRNFPEWKQRQIQRYSETSSAAPELWHLPSGKSIRVTTQPHLRGGCFVLIEDISERLQLESSFTLLTQVQRATLDTLDEGMAIFGTDGCLVLHNALFASMWQLSEEELSCHPHFAEIANICTTRIGRDGIWGIVSCGVNSAMPEQLNEWGKARRADGRLISLSLSRLPNGATAVSFTDLTDLERFGGTKEGLNHAAA